MPEQLQHILETMKISTIWPAIVAALLTVVFEFKRHTWATAALALVSGAFVAYVATEPLVDYFSLPSNARHAVAGLLGISGRNLIVWIFAISKDPLEAWKSMREKK